MEIVGADFGKGVEAEVTELDFHEKAHDDVEQKQSVEKIVENVGLKRTEHESVSNQKGKNQHCEEN
jgi:hypothetical protein